MSSSSASQMPTRLYLFTAPQRRSGGTPYPVYLIQTADGANILIDSGYPEEDYAEEPENHIVRQLAQIGLAPSDIDTVICTHFDDDHAGSHDAFPDAEFVVQRTHYDWAQTAQRVASVRLHWGDPRLHYRLVDGDTELRPGITLLETSGHVPGHQSVLVRLPETGPVLLAIDAVSSGANRDAATRKMSQFDMEEAGTRASTAKLADIAEREGVSLTIYGHDAAQWADLKLAPEYYG